MLREGQREWKSERVPGALHLSLWLVLSKDFFFTPFSFCLSLIYSPRFLFSCDAVAQPLFSPFFLVLSIFLPLLLLLLLLLLPISLFLSIFSFFSLRPFSVRQQKADGVSLTSEWAAQTCREGRGESDRAGGVGGGERGEKAGERYKWSGNWRGAKRRARTSAER